MITPSLPAFIKPMLAVRGEPFDDENFLFEIKWDGIRMLAFIDDCGYRLVNRHGVDTTTRYPEFNFLAGVVPGTILDGEMVVLRDGKPDVALVQSRDKTSAPLKIRTLSRAAPATYVAFDLLYADHQILLQRRLCERRELLEDACASLNNPRVILSHGITGAGRALFEHVCRQQLEGVMAKKLTSVYRPGKRSGDWIKIKSG